MKQTKKQSDTLDEHEQTTSIIEYAHLTSLHLRDARVDYAKEFLFDSNAHLPCLNTLCIDYETLTNVTDNFTNDAARLTCATLKKLMLRRVKVINNTNFFNYFPFVQCRLSS